MKKRAMMFLVCSLLAGKLSLAQDASPPADPVPPSAVFGQMDKLRSENAILAEELKNRKLRQEIESLSKGTAPPAGAQPVKPAPPAMPEPIKPEPPAKTESVKPEQPLPKVLLVSGMGSHLTALVSLPSGGRITAGVGTRIHDVGVVRSITGQQVIVAGEHGPVTLPFADVNSPLPQVGMNPGGR
jgi:type IV pilus biogenesis protein PilP